MAQMAITLAFETLKAQLELAGKTILLDEFVLANIPGQDPSLPIDRAEGAPATKHIVYTRAVTQSGFVNPNAVIYSLIMDTAIGDFDFNWIGLRNKASGVIAAISHIPTISKTKSVPGVKNGNSVTRSMMMSFLGAQSATGITVDAATWQIDFTARLFGIDEAERLDNIDHYGKAAFLSSGYQVIKSGSSYKAKQGTGYVGGLRCHAAGDLTISGAAKSMGIYLDASWQGGLTSEWQTVVSLKASKQVLTDYVDSTGLAHYVTKLADINRAGNVIDCRFLGGTPAFERKDNAATNSEIDSNSEADKHVKLPQFWRGITQKITAAFNSRQVNTTGALQGGGALSANRTLSIKDASTAQKGAVQLSDSVTSTSRVLGSTPKATKTAFDKAVTAETNAIKHADSVASSAQTNAINHANTASNSAETNAKKHADTVAGKAETNANNHANSVATHAETNAKNFAQSLVDRVVGGASGAYDTLKELQNELQGNDNAITALTNAIATKLDKTATAVNSTKLEGKTKAQVIAQARAGLSPNTWRPVSDSVSNTSKTTSASCLAVKTAFDKAVLALNTASQGLPTGIPMPWPLATPPTGWLECRGQTFNKATYPELAIAYPSGVLDDLRDQTIKGWGHGQGIDPGREILSKQGDAIRNIQGSFSGLRTSGGTTGTGVFAKNGSGTYGAAHGTVNDASILFDASLVVPTASENRVKNTAYMYIVRAA